MSDSTDEEQRIQQAQYEFPYHYIPRVDDDGFTQVEHWSWGIHYLGGIRVVLDQLEDCQFGSLVDVGCGDGRFMRELDAAYPDVDSLGVDYSERSIAMARGMNPTLEYEVRNILDDPLDRTFDAATCIEVLEHIPPSDCAEFVAAVADTLAGNGRLVLTVPHTNKPVNDKHYQHFTSEDLSALLDPHFSSVRFVPFDRQSKVFTAIELALGGRGNHFVVNSPPITNTLWRLYNRRYLYAPDEASCRRIAAVCER